MRCGWSALGGRAGSHEQLRDSSSETPAPRLRSSESQELRDSGARLTRLGASLVRCARCSNLSYHPGLTPHYPVSGNQCSRYLRSCRKSLLRLGMYTWSSISMNTNIGLRMCWLRLLLGVMVCEVLETILLMKEAYWSHCFCLLFKFLFSKY